MTVGTFTLWAAMITTSEALAVKFEALALTALAFCWQLHWLEWRLFWDRLDYFNFGFVF